MRTTFSILLIFLFPVLRAQLILRISGDTNKTIIKVAVLNPHGKESIAYKGHSLHYDSVQQALKINPVNFLHGEFSLYYEYRLGNHWSAEAGAGVTYIDYIYEISQNGGRFISRFNGSPGTKFYSGVAGHFQARWFPSYYETAITGFYLAPDISYRSYKMDYLVNTGLISEPHRINREMTDIKLQFGHQDADPYESFFFEWYLAAGFRHLNEDYVEGSGLDSEFFHDNYWKPVLGAGLKIGFTL